MIIIVKKQNDVITSTWAGGESRQYYIYPLYSKYVARDFMFRVSMAISNSEDEAKYSRLENFMRYLIMIEGKAHVFHKYHYDILMKPYEEIDVFDGSWDSYATGKVTDFNLMISKNCTGSMAVINKDMLFKTCYSKDKNKNWIMFFCGFGKAMFELESGENYEISKNELIIFEDIKLEDNINIKLENSKLIQMSVCN